MKCPKCQFENPDTQRFCGECGAKLEKICPKCGSTNIKIHPAGLDVKMTLQDYCEDCKFWGNFLQVKESEVEEFRKELKKHQ